MDYGKVAIAMENGYWKCYDALSGHLLWQTETNEYPWGAFYSYDASSWNGMLFTATYAGVIAYDWDTGKMLWKTPVYAVPYETPYNGEQAFHSASIVADGKLYIYSDEHSPTEPLTRGWKWYCMNATTGEIIWGIQGFNRDSRNFAGSVAEGYLTAADQYSNTMWVFGKGQSATTVTAPDVNVPLGTGFTIKGTVLDMSPGQPNTPCVSHDSMTTQMEYLHMGMPIDGIWGNETITGVPVTLTAIDENGVVTDLGTVTSSGYYGTFEMAWTPPAKGTYKIIASFASDDSYGSSVASTAVTSGSSTRTNNSPRPTDTTRLHMDYNRSSDRSHIFIH